MRRGFLPWLALGVVLASAFAGAACDRGPSMDPSITWGTDAELVVIGRSLGERSDRIEGLDRIHDVEVEEVLWEDEPFRGAGGVSFTWTSPRPGDAIVVIVPDEVEWQGGGSMQLFLSATADIHGALEEAVGGEYWWLRLSVEAATGYVAPDWGVDAGEVRAVLLEGETGSPRERIDALTEFVVQYNEHSARQPRFLRIPGQRYAQWREFVEGEIVDEIGEWLSEDPDRRLVPGTIDGSTADLATALQVTWRPTTFLVEWDDDVAGQWVGIHFDGIGVVGPWYLEPADAAVVADAIVPLDRRGAVYVWPFEVVREPRDSEALVTQRVAMGEMEPLTSGGPALWITIRLLDNGDSVIETVSGAEFRDLTDSIDFRREPTESDG